SSGERQGSNARVQARPTAEWEVRQEGYRPQAGHRHRSVQGEKARCQGAGKGGCQPLTKLVLLSQRGGPEASALRSQLSRIQEVRDKPRPSCRPPAFATLPARQMHTPSHVLEKKCKENEAF